MKANTALIARYDVPAPRYTSYPTVPYWSQTPTTEQWLSAVSRSLSAADAGYAIYLHIPFCETLCSFCGCNTTITRNHNVESDYIALLHRELQLYMERVPELKQRPLRELHLGGGSPTFLSAQSLRALLAPILDQLDVAAEHEFSIEVDPRRTQREQLETLYDLGFRRLSMGVQDFNPEVQRLINRNQTEEDTARTNALAREIGFDSINFDLIYGLPLQSRHRIVHTVQRTIEMRPDRIAFYSYAHVPWIKAAQRLFTEADLPPAPEKRELYEVSRELFLEAGYREIGMDHFALESDSLWQAAQNGALHRNFMGYTALRTDLLLGLGASAISDSGDCFHQNEKVLKKYEQSLREQGRIPTLRGHMLSEEDCRIRELILQLVTTWQVRLPGDLMSDLREYLSAMESDGLVVFEEHDDGGTMRITAAGRPFLRNACMGLDLHLRRHKPETQVFSQSI